MNAALSTLEDLLTRDRSLPLPEAPEAVEVRVVDVAELPTEFGDFKIVAFWNNRDSCDHVALVYGDIVGRSDVLVRLHSECLTGDALGSLRCDCRDQLHQGMRRIVTAGAGVLLYMRQEGRGIGITNKVRAYALQDRGLDTVDANLALGFPDDLRDYAVAAGMVQRLGVRSVRLMTNNPRKVAQLQAHGVEVSGRVVHQLPTNAHNRRYLLTKARRSGHMLDTQAL